MENGAAQPALGASAWDRVLAALRPKLGPGTFDTWFRPTKLLGVEGNRLRVGVPNEMFAEWLRTQYLSAIRSALPDAGFPGADSIEVEFVAPRPQPDSPPVPDREPARLNARYTFDNFVVSSCNQFAHAAALAVSDQPGRTYNPLFLYGGVGLGKTHLMQAIGNRLLERRPEIRLRYLTSEEFMNELIAAIRFEDTPRFRERYRSVDVLLVDDIQFLAGKESTQEEFFHTFNVLYDAGKQIVITSDCPPRAIPGIEERLRSRFEWGLLADIQPPDLETKVAILNKMASSRGWELAPEVALFIAGNVHSNVRELEGCLTTLIASASIQRRKPDLELARRVVRTLVPEERQPVTLDAVIRVVARRFGLKVSELKSRTNARRIAYPRQIAMHLGRKVAGESLQAIGRAFGNMHHTTVLHAVRKIERLMREDPSVHKLVSELESDLG
ncbi:MAG: chromosomal replication initiator protein DnaA [Acidobacteria bacterium]|nr:MAG: chromosomal replication initiator protein DnaA [Acidobacteriota bacterium]